MLIYHVQEFHLRRRLSGNTECCSVEVIVGPVLLATLLKEIGILSRVPTNVDKGDSPVVAVLDGGSNTVCITVDPKLERVEFGDWGPLLHGCSVGIGSS